MFVHSDLEYNSPVWSPCLMYDIQAIEHVLLLAHTVIVSGHDCYSYLNSGACVLTQSGAIKQSSALSDSAALNFFLSQIDQQNTWSFFLKFVSTVAAARPDRNSLQNVSLTYGACLVMSLISPPYLPLSIVQKWLIILNFVLQFNLYYAVLLLLNVMLLCFSYFYFIFQFFFF